LLARIVSLLALVFGLPTALISIANCALQSPHADRRQGAFGMRALKNASASCPAFAASAVGTASAKKGTRATARASANRITTTTTAASGVRRIRAVSCCKSALRNARLKAFASARTTIKGITITPPPVAKSASLDGSVRLARFLVLAMITADAIK